MNDWKPPESPIGMLQESLWPNEWKILIACLLHNLTTRKQVDKVYEELFERYPDPISLKNADLEELQSLIKPLGMWKKRASTLKRFSEEYLKKDWKTPKELHGCGKYAEDCWKVFCSGAWREVETKDHALKRYKVWLEENIVCNKENIII